DNASTDATADIARDYASRDARIRYHRNQRNLGLAGNFNKAFQLSTGRYFKWWAHDDWHPRNLLSRTTEVLEADPSAVLCATGVAIMDDDGEVFEEGRPEVDLLTPPPPVRLPRLIWTLGETHPLFAVMRSDALARTPQYRPFVGGDRVLLAQLILMGGFAGLGDLMHHYRQARMRPGARKDPNKTAQAEDPDPAEKGKPPPGEQGQAALADLAALLRAPPPGRHLGPGAGAEALAGRGRAGPLRGQGRAAAGRRGLPLGPDAGPPGRLRVGVG